MNTAYIYLQLYKLFDDVTPVPVDCGQLCDKACCKGDDSGMFLFPGEKEVFNLLNPDWVRIEKTDFTYDYNGKTYTTPIAMCQGYCDRYQRPLACRIFPLTPYLDKSGHMDIIVSTAQMNLFSYPVWKRQFWFIWKQLRIFWQSDEK